MTSRLFTNIGSLVTNDPTLDRGPLGVLENAAFVVEQGRIAWVGSTSQAPASDRCVDLGGRAVLPGFVESHSHLVFAGDRSHEFAARMEGKPYEAGGIRTTIEATRAASAAELELNTRLLMQEYARAGATTIEVKTGYGQSAESELKSVQVAASCTEEVTLLAAHVAPPEYRDKHDEYVQMVVDTMIPECAPYASWIDVFCERGAFSEDESRAVLQAGMAAGLKARVHGNQLTYGAGVQLAVELGAASVDHVVYLTDADVDALANSSTVATVLPGADFSTRGAYPDARRLLDAGATVALGADCNPGTSFTTSIPFCIALAVRDLHMSPDEAVWAATAGGAAALGRTDIGAITVGARADVLALDAPNHLHLAYRPGVPLVAGVWKDGQTVVHLHEEEN
ncbi:imidazolonepropionase [Rothia sp. SD9660Na]|uniref:imidazolonepropionase n=1 Tax=Rothia sp. SD9660Na TaxID=3047030 RepID=UPI0024B91A37|nr:imidazolonepropionase [Rothia sp. SD9660Na]WHS49617.1 imidazolonepropionase [Rothia sp. SD9660Na]